MPVHSNKRSRSPSAATTRKRRKAAAQASSSSLSSAAGARLDAEGVRENDEAAVADSLATALLSTSRNNTAERLSEHHVSLRSTPGLQRRQPTQQSGHLEWAEMSHELSRSSEQPESTSFERAGSGAVHSFVSTAHAFIDSLTTSAHIEDSAVHAEAPGTSIADEIVDASQTARRVQGMSTGPIALWIDSASNFCYIVIMVFLCSSWFWMLVLLVLHWQLRALNNEVKQTLVSIGRGGWGASRVFRWLFRVSFLLLLSRSLPQLCGLRIADHLSLSAPAPSDSVLDVVWTIAICDALVLYCGLCVKALCLGVGGWLVPAQRRGYVLELQEALLSIYRQLLPVRPWLRVLGALSFGRAGGPERCHSLLGADHEEPGAGLSEQCGASAGLRLCIGLHQSGQEAEAGVLWALSTLFLAFKAAALLATARFLLSALRAALGRSLPYGALLRPRTACQCLCPDSAAACGEADCACAARGGCAVCLGPATEPVRLVCGHVFCHECVLDWLESSAMDATCPLCRRVVRPAALRMSMSGGGWLLPHLF